MQMTIARWTPPVTLTRQEQFLLKRLGRVRKLLGFLRVHRHELFNDVFPADLAAMYRTTGAGKDALPPAMMAMAMLVQGYLGISDAEMIELTVVDLRVQMVLGCLGAEEPPFSQGALQEFRDRLIAADMDRRLLERTGELPNRTKAFDYRKLPKLCASRLIRVRWRARDGSRTRSTCWHTRPATWSGVPPACSGGATRQSVRRRAFRCCWNRVSKRRSTSTGMTRVRRPRRSQRSRVNSTPSKRGSSADCPRKSRSPRSRRRSRPSCRSARRIWSPIRVAEGRAFATGSRRIDGCRSRTRRCGTAARVKASGSMGSNGTSRRTSIGA